MGKNEKKKRRGRIFPAPHAENESRDSSVYFIF
jgi:hypothetical protein